MSLEGQRLGEFEILERLGQGGMGAVYKARQASLRRTVALKTLQAALAGDPEYIARFHNEAVAAAALNHPNLVQVYSAGENDGLHWFAMEYVEGESAQARLKRKGRIEPVEAIAIAMHVATALDYGWRKAQLIHRDIKPDNIFLSGDGEVKLGDLGLAKSAGQTQGLTMTGASMGTPHYISPEQAEGKKDTDLRTDIYSLGCTLYHLLCGQPPYAGDSAVAVMMKHVSAPVPDLRSVWPECPAELSSAVLKMMQKQPADRQQSYAEVNTDLRRAYDALTGKMLPMMMPGSQQPAELGTERAESPVDAAAKPVARGVKLRGRFRGCSISLAVTFAVTILCAVGYFHFNAKRDERARMARIEERARMARIEEMQPADASGSKDQRLSAVIAAATKDKPFVNTLGMKFVPVPITGGPTDGQRVFFSVWDTRVQDYETFVSVSEVKREWTKPDFEQGPTHPAVKVSWDDAKAFCAWLTARERKRGLLGANEAYRLPTDHEWSCAVGIGAREDAAKLPSEKARRITDVFPWGSASAWPPPKGAGNYAGEELRPDLAAGKYDKIKDVIAGYNDGFANTSPVGSFMANQFGLYDLGGNVWQWCEDWFDMERKDRVLRGNAWDSGKRDFLFSSYRNHLSPDYRGPYDGFRCVLAPVPAPAVVVTKDAPFVNTLGMKFVPVPIVSGPTAGQRVLFGVWDVRVQDYAAYANAAGAKKVDDSWTKQNRDGVPAGRELNHPVVGVSWNDAQAFCQWLTEKESAEGRLPKGLKYRLPSDEEWSWAVGMPPELGATPEEKNGKNSVDFPWGKDWPPTKKVGNYADETFHAKFPAEKNEKENRMENQWIEGYTDGFATTSPVGSFPANAYGLYDMGGNVSQWCEDWWNAEHKERVLRGAAWTHNDRGLLRSSNRAHSTPAHRYYNNGFRCVVGESAR